MKIHKQRIQAADFSLNILIAYEKRQSTYPENTR
jgi:hypothetical protein